MKPSELMESFSALPWDIEELPEAGTPIEVLRKGTFTDSAGNEVTVDDELLDALLDGFAMGVYGQEIPLDIDHKREEAVGWIRQLYRDADRLYAVPEWNELGRQIVGDKVYRYVSATINRVGRFLVSVSLTNFPAVKGLAPLALSENLYLWGPRLVDGGEIGERDGGPDTPRLLMLGGTTMDVKEMEVEARPVDGTEVEAEAEVEAEVEVEVEAEAEVEDEVEGEEEDAGTAEGIDPELATAGDEDADPDGLGEEEETLDKNALVKELAESIRAELTAEFKGTLAEAVARAQQELRDQLQGQIMDDLKESADLSSFAERVTGTGRHALPVMAADLESLLKRTPSAVRTEWRELIKGVYESGTVDFGERGTAAGRNETHSLDSLTRGSLIGWHQAGHDISEFFEVNGLGDPKDYDLSFLKGA